jgi:CRISPR-associated endonuclease/helicase Cas3
MSADPESFTNHAVPLETHLADTQREAIALLTSLDQHDHTSAISTAALWHDIGKSHPVFQKTLHDTPDGLVLLAKSPSNKRHGRRYFRHELASALSWLAHGKQDDDHNLIAYLIAAHHGKVRMSIRALPDEKPPNDNQCRYARGIHEGDRLPAIDVSSITIPETPLSLEIMEIGQTDSGESWSSRTQTLLERHGPFVLAWLETLVRIADWRASNRPSKTLQGFSDRTNS